MKCLNITFLILVLPFCSSGQGEDHYRHRLIAEIDTIQQSIVKLRSFYLDSAEILHQLDRLEVGLDQCETSIRRNAKLSESAGLGFLREFINYKKLLTFDLVDHNRINFIDVVKFLNSDLSVKENLLYAAISSSINIELVRVKISIYDSLDHELPGYIAYLRPKICVSEEYVQTFSPTTRAVNDVVPGVKTVSVYRRGQFITGRNETIEFDASGKTKNITFSISK